MPSLMDEIVSGGSAPKPDPRFPHAPEGWTPALAAQTAKSESLQLGDGHWETIRALQEYYAKHEHHLPVIERSKEICEQIVAADFEI